MLYPVAAVEWAMKVQEVILRALTGTLTRLRGSKSRDRRSLYESLAPQGRPASSLRCRPHGRHQSPTVSHREVSTADSCNERSW